MSVSQAGPTSARCIHGMIKVSCALCLPPRRARVPVKTTKSSPHGSRAELLDLPRYGIAVVHIAHRSREHSLINIGQMDPAIEMVHICGNLFLWVVEALLARLPNLKAIQVIPGQLDLVGPSARAMCSARGVQIVSGHIQPERAWDDGRIGNPQYAAQRRFLLGMTGEQLSMFNELIALGFDAAKMTARYFCLAEEEYVPQRMLTAEYGFAAVSSSMVSEIILGVLCYIDDTLEVGDGARRRALSLRERVARLRPLLASAEHRQRVIRELEIPCLPPSLPLARLDVYAKILAAARSGKLRALNLERPRDYEALTLRFGLDKPDAPTYRTLLETGEMMGGLTRERVRQLEERALTWLGIDEES